MTINEDVLTAQPSLMSRLVELAREHENMLKYGVIGASAVAVDLGLFIVLHELFGVTPWVSHSVSVGVAVIWSFLLNAFFNFKTTDKLVARFISFSAVAFVGYLVGLVVIWAALGLGATPAKIISMPLVFLTQYILNTRFSFRSTQ